MRWPMDRNIVNIIIYYLIDIKMLNELLRFNINKCILSLLSVPIVDINLT